MVASGRNPLKAGSYKKGLQERLDPGACVMPSIRGLFFPLSLSSSLSSAFLCASWFIFQKKEIPLPGFFFGNGGGSGSSRLSSSQLQVHGKGTDLSLGCFSKALRLAQV